MPQRLLLPALIALAALLATTGCTGESDSEAAPASTTTLAESSEPTPSEPDETDEPEESDEPEDTPTERPEPPPDPVSVEAIIERGYNGGGLRVGRVLAEYDVYTRYAVSYRSEDLRVSGIMNVPDGRGPFPALVLNHGYIDPAVYVTGQGMAREQDWLARQGYVVLHTDYRNHAASDPYPTADYELRLPYAVDVVNAVKAIKGSDLPYLDGDRVGLLGRSMGGNVTLNAMVARPGLIDAAAIYASTSSLAADNWRQFYQGDPGRADVNARIDRTYGLPAESPAFWRRASPRAYFDRVEAPLLIHHGKRDFTCPIGWSVDTAAALRAAGKQVELIRYQGEGHTMYAQWQRSIERTTRFFDRNLR